MAYGYGANLLITGADMGIGNGLVRFLAKEHEVKRIFACCYDPENVEVCCLQTVNSKFIFYSRLSHIKCLC